MERVPGARVAIRGAATGAESQTAANSAGLYTPANLPPGGYSLTFEARGFKRLVRANLTLRVTGVLRAGAQLEAGAITESVEVTSEITRLQTGSPEAGAALTRFAAGLQRLQQIRRRTTPTAWRSGSILAAGGRM